MAYFSWSAIAHKSDYLKRLLGTILGFSLFGLGGIILYLTLFQLVALVSRDKFKRQNRIRSVIRHTFKAFLRMLELFGVLKVETSHLESLHDLRGALIICNHPSLLDVVILVSRLQNVQCVVKNELWMNPLIGGVVRAAGYIRNDIDPEIFLKDCKQQLDAGENIIIFPEGTRSLSMQPIKFHRGVGNLALAAKANIQALTLDCEPPFLKKGAKWHSIAGKKVIFKLQVGRFFPIEPYHDETTPRSIRVRALIRDIQHYYNRYLGYE